jgi:hypothetical protein
MEDGINNYILLLCFRVLTWAGGLCCRCVAMNKLYTWTTTGLAACFPSFMACLLARQEGAKRKTTKDDRHRRLWLTRNTPREQLVLTRETDPTFFDAVRTSISSGMAPGPISVPKEPGAWLIGRGACPILVP